MHAPLSWKVERVEGYPVSITQTLLVSVAAGSSALSAHARWLTVKWTQEMCEQPSQHTVLSTLGVWYQDQSILFAPVLYGKKEQKRCSCDVIQNTKCGLLLKMAVGQNLQYEDRALFPVFIYLYNICTDFFFFFFFYLKWRMNWHLGCQKT